MSRISNILVRVRSAIADQNGQRWSDTRLLIALNEGAEDLAKRTRVLRGYHEQMIFINTPEYNLPADCWEILRVGINTAQLPVYSIFHMDTKTEGMWMLEKGEKPKAIIHDAAGMSKLRVYPIPSLDSGSYEMNSTSGVTGTITVNDETADGSLYGMFEDLTTTTEYNGVGVAVPVNTTDTDNFGVLSNIQTSAGGLQVWYVKLPAPVDVAADPATLEDLDLPTSFDTALVHYIAGSVFQDDIDIQNREHAAAKFSLYSRELEGLIQLFSRSRQGSPLAHAIPYKTGFSR